jgi:hypothetical protein
LTRETAAADFGERQPQRELLENREILSRFVGLAQRELIKKGQGSGTAPKWRFWPLSLI